MKEYNQTFSQKVKDELVNRPYLDRYAIFFLSSYMTNNVSININNNKMTYELRSQFNNIIKLLYVLLQKHFPLLELQLSYSDISNLNLHRTYKIDIYDQDEIITNQLLDHYQNLSDFINGEAMQAFLAGAFLSGGSISNIKSSSYHFEIRSNRASYLRVIQAIFEHFGVVLAILKKRNGFILYNKRSNDISDILKILQVNDALFEFENTVTNRNHLSRINRLNNIDLSNLKKTSLAASNQIKWIERITNTSSLWRDLDEKTKVFCRIRLENQSLSLNEIANLMQTKYDIKCSRTGLNHIVRKIERLAASIKK